MYLLFDIGGTNMRLAISKDGKNIGKIKIVPTPQDFIKGMKLFEESARELSCPLLFGWLML
jgi:predicted NBD/HSP70 family sugar kinase